jgi:hypothetical protein
MPALYSEKAEHTKQTPVQAACDGGGGGFQPRESSLDNSTAALFNHKWE